MSLTVDPIGVVRSPVSEGRDDGWGEVISEIVLDGKWARGLDGIEEFSHLLVVYWMHQSSWDAGSDLVRHPRGRADLPRVGIFAQRAKHRPNPVGITAVKFVSREGAIVKVKGLDAIDGTPVIDLKPYVPEFDRIDSPTGPEWIREIMKDYF